MDNQVCFPEKLLHALRKDLLFNLVPEQPRRPATGLASWAVYQHVALRLSFEDIGLSLNDLFGYSLQWQDWTACSNSLG